MFRPGGDYWAATRHPWSCVLFVVPLLVIYEIGIYTFGPTPVVLLRNGADIWLRAGLSNVGISPIYGPPVILLLILLGWTLLYREARPRDPVGVWIGMAIEGVVFATILYAFSQVLWPYIQSLAGVLEGQSRRAAAIPMALPSAQLSGSQSSEPAVVNLVRYIGAGIYEETLFRLLLFSGLLAAFNLAELPRRWAVSIAAVAAALLFAGAHNLPPSGETFQSSLFLFRTAAGAYFAWIYCVRGFGIAVGAHAGYDVLVGLLVKSPLL